MYKHFLSGKVSALTQNQQNKISRLARSNTTNYFWKTNVFSYLLALCCFVSLCNSVTARTTSMESSASTTSFSTDSIPPTYSYGDSEEFTPKGSNRTDVDFQNYYLQVNSSRNRAAAMDEYRFYSKYWNTQLLEGDGPMKFKIIIGPFDTRSDARYEKHLHSDKIKSDAFPRPSHEIIKMRRP